MNRKFQIYVMAYSLILAPSSLFSTLSDLSPLEKLDRNILKIIVSECEWADELALRSASKALITKIKAVRQYTHEDIAQLEVKGRLDWEQVRKFAKRYPFGARVLYKLGLKGPRIFPITNSMSQDLLRQMHPYMRAIKVSSESGYVEAKRLYDSLIENTVRFSMQGLTEGYRFTAEFGSISHKFIAGHKFSGIKVYPFDNMILHHSEEAHYWYTTALNELRKSDENLAPRDFQLVIEFFDKCHDDEAVINCYEVIEAKLHIDETPAIAAYLAMTAYLKNQNYRKALSCSDLFLHRTGHSADAALWNARCKILMGVEQYRGRTNTWHTDSILGDAIEAYFELNNLIPFDYMLCTEALVYLKKYNRATKLAETHLLLNPKLDPTINYLNALGLAYFKKGQYSGEFSGCGIVARDAAKMGNIPPYDEIKFAVYAAYAKDWKTAESLIGSIAAQCIYKDNMVRYVISYLYYLNPIWRKHAAPELVSLQEDLRVNESAFMFLDEVIIGTKLILDTAETFNFFNRFAQMTRAPGNENKGSRSQVYDNRLLVVEPKLKETKKIGPPILERHLHSAVKIFQMHDSLYAFQQVMEHGNFDHHLHMLLVLMKKDTGFIPWASQVEDRLGKQLTRLKVDGLASHGIRKAKESILSLISKEIQQHKTTIGSLLILEHGTALQILRLANLYFSWADPDDASKSIWLNEAKKLYARVIDLTSKEQYIWEAMWSIYSKSIGAKLIDLVSAPSPQSQNMPLRASIEWKALQLFDSEFKTTQVQYMQDRLLTGIDFEHARSMQPFLTLTHEEYKLRKNQHKLLQLRASALKFTDFKSWQRCQIKLLAHLSFDPMNEGDRLKAAWASKLVRSDDETVNELLKLQNNYNEAFDKVVYKDLDHWLKSYFSNK